MMEIYYENSQGVRLDLLGPSYKLQAADIFDYRWDYISGITSRKSGKITGFTRNIEEKTLLLSIVNCGRSAYYDSVNRFSETIEFDVLNETPGKLYVGNMYLKCYIIGSVKTEWENDVDLLDNEITLVIDYPFWIREKTYTYRKRDHTVVEDDYLDYPVDYNYDYSPNENARHIENEESPGVIKAIIQGPCVNPSFKIAGNQYQIMIELTSFEYIVLDGFKRTVYKVSQAGSIQNVWNSLNKDYDNFAKVPNGEHIVEYDGSYTLQIVLYQERSEPKWTM